MPCISVTQPTDVFSRYCLLAAHGSSKIGMNIQSNNSHIIKENLPAVSSSGGFSYCKNMPEDSFFKL